jgi:hypothetical protein
MRNSRLILATTLALVSSLTIATANYRTGWIFDHTSVEGALLIRFDPNVTALPDICAGSGSTWMAIPESNKAIMAVTLMAIATNNRNVTVYAKGVGATGYCELVQVDPQG